MGIEIPFVESERRAGVVVPGEYDVTKPILLEPGHNFRGRTSVILHPKPGVRMFELYGTQTVSGFEIVGNYESEIGLNLRDNAHDVTVQDVAIRRTGLAALWVGSCGRCLIERVFVESSADNGLQIEHGGVSVRNCAFVGEFGNKAVDARHGPGYATRFVHNTIVSSSGRGIDLLGWTRTGTMARGLVLANNLVIVPSSLTGSITYAISAPPIEPATEWDQDATPVVFRGNVATGPSTGGTAVVLPPAGPGVLPTLLKGGTWNLTSWAELEPDGLALAQSLLVPIDFALRRDALGRNRQMRAVDGEARVCAGAVDFSG
jgi:hypothetical protein